MKIRPIHEIGVLNVLKVTHLKKKKYNFVNFIFVLCVPKLLIPAGR